MQFRLSVSKIKRRAKGTLTMNPEYNVTCHYIPGKHLKINNMILFKA